MKTGKFLRKLTFLFTLILLLTYPVHTVYGDMSDSTGSLVNVFVPEEQTAYAIQLEKLIEHPLGKDYKIPEIIAFSFTLDFGVLYANTEIRTSQGKLKTDSAGCVQVQLKPGVAFRVEQLRDGTTVKITELPVTLPGFSVKGDATKTVTVEADSPTTVRFTNRYTPEAVTANSISLSGSKTLTGRDWQEGDSFAVKLEQQSGNNWKQLSTQTITYNPNDQDFNRFNFDSVLKQLTFDKVGIYTFRVSEVVGNLENIDYDQTVNHFQIKVTDLDMDGKLEINRVTGTENSEVTEIDGKFQIQITFHNTYVPPVDFPKTGDPSNVQFWLIMSAVSGTGFVVLLIVEIIQRKKKKDQP